MKKILTFISLFIMILTLSSCGVKKEIKEKTLPDGNTLDEESISQYAEEIKTIYDSEVENYNKLETSWYSISTDAITEEETENNDYTEKTKAWLNMEYLFYDTPLSYESKSKMTITCKVETEKIYTSVDRIGENENAVINLKAKVIKIDGKVYLDLDVKTKTNNSESKTNQKYSYDASSFDMSYIESIIRGLGIDVSLDVIFDDGISFNQSLKKTMYQSFEKIGNKKDEKIGNKKDSGTTTSDDTISAVIKSKKGFAVSMFKDTNNESEKSNMIWECDDNYDTKKLYIYSKNVQENSKATISMEVKKVLFGVVIAPTETEKYEAK